MTPAARLIWVRMYERTGNAGLTCRRCGISRPTLRKWWRRYLAQGLDGLRDLSRRPRRSPARKVGPREEKIIVSLRRQRKLGIKRLRNELQRLHELRLSVDTIHKVLRRHGLNMLKRRKLPRKQRYRRYERPVPGDRVQLDVCKIAPGLYQYTAIDDCSRYVVVAIFPRKTAASTLAFLDQVIEEMPFPIQRIQTDRGQEFFAYKVQDRLQDWHIKFRPIRPRSPHLNGKVERVQRTALEEFWASVDLEDPGLAERQAEWQQFYNWERPHDALGNRPPIDRVCERFPATPLSEEVWHAYDPTLEFVAPREGFPCRQPC